MRSNRDSRTETTHCGATNYGGTQMPDLRPENLKYRPALPEDAEECLVVRGRTRQNAASEDWLRSIGITSESWARSIRSGALPGHVCTVDEKIVGFCFGARETGEIEVVALLPDFENLGIGKKLLDKTSQKLAKLTKIAVAEINIILV